MLIKLKMVVTRRDKARIKWNYVFANDFFKTKCPMPFGTFIQMDGSRIHIFTVFYNSARIYIARTQKHTYLLLLKIHSYRDLVKHITALNNVCRQRSANNKFHFRVAYFCSTNVWINDWNGRLYVAVLVLCWRWEG